MAGTTCATEPRLSPQDVACWDRWRLTAALHARLRGHQRHVDQARATLDRWMKASDKRAVMWSGGKDSTVMVHLAVSLDPWLTLISEKDDLDYPGEDEYVTDLAATWGVQLRIVRPEVSPAAWIEAHTKDLSVSSDFHSRCAELSKACFYGVIEQATSGLDGIALGLRKDESRARMMNRATRGTLYRARGQWVCTPLADWTGLDVMAYAEANGIDLLPVYRCVAFMHAREPWRIRKSWWLPEPSSTRHGGVAWLRHYYPSLYRRLCGWVGEFSAMT